MKAMEKALFDAYVKKMVELVLRDARLTLAVSQTLFSSHQVDIGTMHLLKTLEGHLSDGAAKILDLGCGYGPIGLALGKLLPGSEVHLVDRDALALAFVRHNADLNAINGIFVYGSLGYDNVENGNFDLIASNIPGKAGDEIIRSLLHDARHYLAPEGRVAIVVVSPLEPLVVEALSQPDIEILVHQTLAAHSVFHYRFVPSPDQADRLPDGVERGLYDREALTFIVDDLTMSMQTAQGLPDFDTVSFQSALLVKSLQELQMKSVDHAAVFHPGQGHVPVVLWRLIEPHTLHLVDRDLLSLRYSRLNLLSNGCDDERLRVHHQVALVPQSDQMDLIAGVLREDEGPEVIEQALLEAASSLTAEGRLLIVGGSTPVTRVLKSKALTQQLHTLKRKRHKGNSVALFQRR
jgi:16S rRNA (guanine1207-N2)-methyltransferase